MSKSNKRQDVLTLFISVKLALDDAPAACKTLHQRGGNGRKEYTAGETYSYPST